MPEKYSIFSIKECIWQTNPSMAKLKNTEKMHL